MDNYFLYFPEDKKAGATGLTVLNAGCTRIKKNSRYPPLPHPSHHHFSWKSGRVLEEYQLIYITRGGGLFESEGCREVIEEGTMILLHPRERHRYRPHPHSGWDETWVGFRGDLIDRLITENRSIAEKTVFHIGYNETIVQLFRDIHRYSRGSTPACQLVIAGAILHLLGLVIGESQRPERETADRIEEMVTRACALFGDQGDKRVSPERLAAELNVSYSLFRKVFKKYTGVSPGQYLIGLRIQKAKTLLAESDKLIKEISYELDMDSPLYFCKLFKDKVGMTPGEYRRQVVGQSH